MRTEIKIIKSIGIICCLAFLLTSCYTANHAFNSGSKTPIYLKINDSKNYQFYVDGIAVQPKSTLYKSRLVSSSSNTVLNTTYTTNTYERTYLPALNVKANKPYVTVKVVSEGGGETKDYLLKSNTSEGFKFIMYFQGAMTGGIGNIIDFTSNSIYAWPVLVSNK